MASPERLPRADGEHLAYHHSTGHTPGVLFCPGFHSDMQGEKALELERWCRNTGRQYTRFDYFGHGQSSGEVARGRIGRWREDTLAILDAVTEGPQVIVGSSMGGWMMLLAALARPDRVAGLVGIASAPDFPRFMRENLLDDARLAVLDRQGYVDLPSDYPGEDSYRIEKDFLDEADSHLLLDDTIPLSLPVRLLHGLADEDIRWQRSLSVAEQLAGDDVEVILVKGGDHRLSRPADLRRLIRVLEDLLAGLNP